MKYIYILLLLLLFNEKIYNILYFIKHIVKYILELYIYMQNLFMQNILKLVQMKRDDST